MNDPINSRPVYEADQVLTVFDLVGIRRGYVHQYRRTPPWDVNRRTMLAIGVQVCDEMLHWLHHGKPSKGVDPRDCGGDK